MSSARGGFQEQKPTTRSLTHLWTEFETIATYTEVISRLSSTEVISFLLRVTCVIFERAINTDVWQAMVARAIESQ